MQNATYREILNQPDVWNAVLHKVDNQLKTLEQYSQAKDTLSLVFTGCGSPYYLAQTVATSFRELSSAHAVAYPASNIWLFPESHLRANDELLICISRSGETTEILKAVETFRNINNGHVISITCYADTPLSKMSSETIVLDMAQEESLTQTQSFTSMLIATQALIHTLAQKTVNTYLKQLPNLCEELLTEYHDLAQELGTNLQYERFFFLGDGSLYGIANEAMLKMKEMTLTYAESYHFLEFRHGPMAMVDDKTLVVGLVSDAAVNHELAVLQEMKAKGADVLVLSSDKINAHMLNHSVSLPSELSQSERIALYLPVLQLMACYRAVARGLDPDSPANLNAFVRLDLENIEN